MSAGNNAHDLLVYCAATVPETVPEGFIINSFFVEHEFFSWQFIAGPLCCYSTTISGIHSFSSVTASGCRIYVLRGKHGLNRNTIVL